MKKGILSDYFEGAAAKRLSAVEINPEKSNQHEFQGIAGILAFLGRPSEKQTYSANFMYLTDADPIPLVEEATITLYDSRINQNRPPEYRLYYPSTAVTEKAAEGDLLIVAKRSNGTLQIIIAEQQSTIARQLEWLFGFDSFRDRGFTPVAKSSLGKRQNEFLSAMVLESLGIEVENIQDSFLDGLLDSFSGGFPTTREFSTYARSTLPHISVHDNPDDVLLAWLEREDILFRTFERHMLDDMLLEGFRDVDDFIEKSLSVQNRRKSRAGHSLELHLEYLFSQRGIAFSRGAVTEGKSKPDFVFPSIRDYHTSAFSTSLLTMLGAKTTCKDRWRQILSEARRIQQKHLLTLEPGISVYQTEEMKEQFVQLVVPQEIHTTYTVEQQQWLMNVDSFLELVLTRQKTEKI